MSPIVITLALTAALAHATWNAFLRSGADRFWVVTVMSLTMMVVARPFAFVLPLPTEGAWPFLLLSSVLQVVYSLFLVAAYRHGDLGQVYPIIRGTVPILVTAGGFLFAGDVLHPAALAGIVVIACGVMALAVGRGRATSVSIRWALGAGALVATYATVDAAGVRQAGDPLVYTVWISLLYGALLWLAFAVVRGRIVIDLKSSETWKAAGGGMVSMAAYGLIVAAFSLGPAGGVTALRETNIVFAALIGTVFLGEALTWRRLLACLAVVGARSPSATPDSRGRISPVQIACSQLFGKEPATEAGPSGSSMPDLAPDIEEKRPITRKGTARVVIHVTTGWLGRVTNDSARFLTRERSNPAVRQVKHVLDLAGREPTAERCSHVADRHRKEAAVDAASQVNRPGQSGQRRSGRGYRPGAVFPVGSCWRFQIERLVEGHRSLLPPPRECLRYTP